MWHHLISLLSQSGQSFLAALGTTGLGWWVQGIIWFAATEIVTYLVIWGMRGKIAMKTHAAENFRIGFYIWLIVMVCVYGPIFGWKVVKTVYNDHIELVSANEKLVAENGTLIDEGRAKDARIKQLESRPLNAGKQESPSAAAGSTLRPKSEEEKTALREALGNFVQRGMALRDRTSVGGTSKKQLEDESQKWFEEVQSYLQKNFDSSYVSQFQLTYTELTPADVPTEMLPLWHGINERTHTLDRFIDQLK
jgi:hypothetical protein